MRKHARSVGPRRFWLSAQGIGGAFVSELGSAAATNLPKFSQLLMRPVRFFLLRGFESASIDEIAEVARSGKRTIYARFEDKRALFTEVVTRDILVRIAEFKVEMPSGTTVEERLTSAASTLLHWVLDTDKIGLMRLVIAEARRFPDLAATVNRRARELSIELGGAPSARPDAVRRAREALGLRSRAPCDDGAVLPRSCRGADVVQGAVRCESPSARP